MMGSVEILSLGQFTVDNNYSSNRLLQEVGLIWSIIQIIYCNTPIDDVDYYHPYFYVFVIWYWPTPEENFNINTQPILS